MTDHARVVVIGGGITGCAVLYHLAKMGWKDVMLVERDELTSGSSWHAGGQSVRAYQPFNRATVAALHHRSLPAVGKGNRTGKSVTTRPVASPWRPARNKK